MPNTIIENGILTHVDPSDLNEGHYDMPDTVEKIGSGAFGDCRHQLLSVTLSKSVIEIEDFAFGNGLHQLHAIILPQGLRLKNDSAQSNDDNEEYFRIESNAFPKLKTYYIIIDEPDPKRYKKIDTAVSGDARKRLFNPYTFQQKLTEQKNDILKAIKALKTVTKNDDDRSRLLELEKAVNTSSKIEVKDLPKLTNTLNSHAQYLQSRSNKYKLLSKLVLGLAFLLAGAAITVATCGVGTPVAIGLGIAGAAALTASTTGFFKSRSMKQSAGVVQSILESSKNAPK